MSEKELIKQLEEVIVDKHKEIERLKNIIKEVREYIDKWKFETAGNGACMDYEDIQDIIHILDKENK